MMEIDEDQYQAFVDDLYRAVCGGFSEEDGEIVGFDPGTATRKVIKVLIRHKMILHINEEELN